MFRWPWQSRQEKTQKRYAAAQLSRFIDFMQALEVAHQERLRDLVRLRAHSRSLIKDNVYAARFMGMETAGVQEHQWTTAHDEAVRDSHRELDGQVRRVGEEFKPGLRYPGDPAAPLEETVNCRCILVAAETALGDTAP